MNKLLKKDIKRKSGHKCIQCGGTENLTIDHKIPKAEGGTDNPRNLQVLCGVCNMKKGYMPPLWWRIKNILTGELELYHLKNSLRGDLYKDFGSRFNRIHDKLKLFVRDEIKREIGERYGIKELVSTQGEVIKKDIQLNLVETINRQNQRINELQRELEDTQFVLSRLVDELGVPLTRFRKPE